MASNVFELQASIGIDASKFIDGIKNAMKNADSMKKSIENISGNVSDAQKSFETASKSLDTLGKGTDKADDQLASLNNRLAMAQIATEEAAKDVDYLRKAFNEQADSAGLSAESTKELNSALEQAEKELKRCETAESRAQQALDDYTESVNDAEDGSEDLADESKKLGDATKKAGDRATESSGKFEKFGNSLKNVASTAGKVVSAVAKISAVAIGAAAAGLTALTKQALDASASYEQLKGGVETLFGAGGMDLQEYADSVGKSVDEVRSHYEKLMSAQDKVMQNSYNAFKTAGMSSNQYMETVTSFSASLLQSVAGDTNIAADIADMAIRDMSDNANKMGTDMQSIQNAYQGFAKQNYTINLMSAA